MELKQIRHFVAVVQSGSFTAAAEISGVSQPGLTKSIRTLEQELGGQLFHREGNRTLLTEFGRAMSPLFSQLNEQALATRRAAESFQVLDTGSLRLGIMSTIGGGKLAPWLADFRRRHPGIDLELHQAPGDEITMRLNQAELDLAIINTMLHEREAHHAEILYRERYVVVFAAGHRFESYSHINLTDLQGEAYVDRLSCEFRKQFQALCQDKQLTLVPVARSEREDWTQALVAAGFGCAVIPEYSTQHPQLLTRPLVNPDVTREVSLVRARGRQLSKSALALKRVLRKRAAAVAEASGLPESA